MFRIFYSGLHLLAMKDQKVDEKPPSYIQDTKVETQHVEKTAQHVMSSVEKKLVRKINWTFMPYVCLILFIQVRMCVHI